MIAIEFRGRLSKPGMLEKEVLESLEKYLRSVLTKWPAGIYFLDENIPEWRIALLGEGWEKIPFSGELNAMVEIK